MIGKEYVEMVNQQNDKIDFVAPLTGAWEFMPNLKVFIPDWRKDLLALIEISGTNKWNSNINFRQQLEEHKKTIIVTGADQIIWWTSSYFEAMTGYKKEEALGKRPNFLQGKDTSFVTREKIRYAIRDERIVKEELINYRKDGSSYKCIVKIIPIYNFEKQLVNFIALEKDIK